MGLELSSPIIVGSSPFTSTLGGVIAAAESGAGAVILKSIFEEQITLRAAWAVSPTDHTEAADYLGYYLNSDYREHFVDLISRAARRVRIPIVASINATSAEGWTNYAAALSDAGASAPQLNIVLHSSSPDETSEQLEERYFEIVSRVADAVSVPICVKLTPHFTSLSNVCAQLYNRGAVAVTLFNREFVPDIDTSRLAYRTSDGWSDGCELTRTLRSVAFASGEVPHVDFALSSGVLSGDDAVKALLSGARAVEVCSALHHGGLDIIEQMNDYISAWGDRHGFDSVASFCGLLNNSSRLGQKNTDLLYRSQYLKYYPAGRS